MREIADHAETIAIFFKRAERFGKRKVLAFGGRRPFVHRGAMRNIETAEPCFWKSGGVFQRSLRRYHGFQKRQRDRDTRTAQKCPPGKMLFADEHYGVSSAFLTRI